MRALISVSDKTGIIEFAKNLQSLGITIISTGGTFKALSENGIDAVGISDITGFPECLDGRVKTLHPNVHGGILAVRDSDSHLNQLKELSIDLIDLVIVNLYPFEETIKKDSFTLSEAIENIDIGGPTMLRSAAKNYKFVSSIVDPNDYGLVIDELKKQGKVSEKTNLYLSSKVFAHTARYDALIASYLNAEQGNDIFNETVTLTFKKISDMRYGENPHQKAAFYGEFSKEKGLLANAVKLHGKELSFNNINDTNGALDLLKEFNEPTVVACKHGNPCGVACGTNIFDAYIKAYESDPQSIFGGIVVANREIDSKTAEKMNEIFLEIILAPSFSDEAMSILTKKKNIRLLTLSDISAQPNVAYDFKKVSGGILIQETDKFIFNKNELKQVTVKAPTEKELSDMEFGFKIVKYVKSNGIAIVKDGRSLGIGPGQVNRIWALKQAIEHAKEYFGEDALKGAVLASDAYFPFSDCVIEAEKAGITAIIQPGGSIRDNDSIEKCDEFGISMMFTGMRHFKH